MKKFVLFIAKILGLLFLLLCLFDLVFTQVYLHDSNRNKTNAIYNSEKKNFDVIFLGSSRANNHFVTSVFEKAGLKTFNYGVSGSHLYETALMLELMLERDYQIKNVIIQIDLNIGGDQQPSPKHTAQFLPYIHHSKTIANYLSDQPDYYAWYYVPFYRYIEYGAVIGFRECWDTFRKKPSNLMHDGGFYALKGEGKNMKNNLTGLIANRNESYEKIKALCKKNNIRLIAVTTPICENTKNREYFDEVTKVYPEIQRYDTVVKDDRYFTTCGHMNINGATILTKKLLKDFFNK
ncbi:hypothetical protein [Flavobacterium maritimum]|uniref:hypothetical protein n=1 Tax=Flavobacterium maritimum TaxID=3149042 RepID=UPI0032B36384